MTFCRSPFDLSPVELASGLVFGTVRRDVPAPEGVPHGPLAALQQAVIPALANGPCFVSFSGGRDSSAVLAAAVTAARREGLPLPVPVTNVFPEAAESSETQWQQLVVEHLGLTEWVRVELTHELDCVGPLAQRILERHGLLWPFNAHFHAPLLEIARGGTLLTGIGGDELLGESHRARAAEVLAGASRPQLRDVVRVGVALAPHRVRSAVARRRYPTDTHLPWLTDAANIEVRRLAAADLAREPLRWSARWRWWNRRRETEIGLRSLDLVARDYEAKIEHPFADGGFVAAVAQLAADKRLQDRTSVYEAVFSSVLPAPLRERTSKAAFGPVFFGPASRSLAKTAVEEVVELEPVDERRLRATWAEAEPDAHSYLLLQAALVRRSEAGGSSADLPFGTVADAPAAP